MKLNFYTIAIPIVLILLAVVIYLVVIQKNKDICENINKKKCSDIITENK